MECSDAYQQLGAQAWPVRMLAERGAPERACSILREAIPRLTDVEPASSRSEAAFLLFQAGFYASDALRQELATALLELGGDDAHWRTRRNAVDAISMISAVDEDLAAHLLVEAAGSRVRAKVVRETASGRRTEPRRFFW